MAEQVGWDDGAFYEGPQQHVPWKEVGEVEVTVTVDLSGDGAVSYRDLVVGHISTDSRDPAADAGRVMREWIDERWDRLKHPWSFR